MQNGSSSVIKHKFSIYWHEDLIIKKKKKILLKHTTKLMIAIFDYPFLTSRINCSKK